MNTKFLRRMRASLRLGSVASIALSSVALLSAPSSVSAAPGDTWNETGRAAGDTTSTTINGYTSNEGMGLFEMTHTVTGEIDYALCIDPTITHETTANYEHATNTVASSELDYLLWKYARSTTGYTDGMSAQALAWYYVGGMRSSPAVPVWWDTLNNNAVTPFSPDPWNALPTFSYAAPGKPVGMQRSDDFSTGFDPGDDNVEIAIYNMAVDVEANHGPWTLSDTGTPGQISLSNPTDATFNPNGRVENVDIQWYNSSGALVGTSTTDANGIANDPSGGNATEARVEAPGTHREANANGLQMLALPGSTILSVTVAAPVSEPVVATQISTSLARAGVPISDSVILSGMEPGQTATIQLQLFNLTHDPNGTGTPLVDVTVSGIGNGTTAGLASYTPTFADAGDSLGYRERIVTTTDGAPASDWSDLGVASETTPVDISNPSTFTVISTNLAVAGQTITDSITISGLVGGATADVQFQLFNLTHDPTGAGTPLVDVVVTGLQGTSTGHAPYLVTFADAGDQLGYRERIVTTSDGVSTGWSALGISNETTPVDISEPVVNTQISTSLAVAGQTVTDSITVAGLVGGATADVQLQLFNLTEDPTGSGTPLADVTVTGLGNGTTSGHAPYLVTFADAGDDLGYRERVVSTSDGVSTGWSSLGVVSETTPVDISEPVVTTQISDQDTVAGDVITDSITITGLVGGALADVQLQLFNLVHDPNGTGTPLVDVTIPNLANGTHNGLGTYTITFADAGDQLGYRERVVATSDGVTTDWSALGIVSETTVVDISEPVIVTQISDQEVFAGETITDTITLTGMVGNALADVQLQLFNLADDPNGTGTPLVDVTIPNLDNGTHAGFGSYLVDLVDAGDQLGYRERVIATSDAVTTEWSDLGLVNETTNVLKQPAVITNVSGSVAEPGNTISDALTVIDVADHLGEEIDIEVSLYDLTLDATCTSPLTTEVVTVGADGTYPGVAPYTVLSSQRGHSLGYVEQIISSSDPLRISDDEWTPSVCGAVSESLFITDKARLVTVASIFEDLVEVTDLYDEHTTEVVSFDAEGNVVTETVTIPAETVEVTATLHGPFNNVTESGFLCDAETVVQQVVVTGVEEGQTTIPFDAATEYGIYTFQVSFSSENLPNRSVSHGCGIAAESFVFNPDLGVNTSTQGVVDVSDGPAEVADIVDVTDVGITLDGDDSAWSGEVTLYGPYLTLADATCSASEAVSTSTMYGVGDVSGLEVDGFTVSEPGIYTFVASVIREVDGASASHSCALAEESFAALGATEIDTNASDGTIGVGEMTHDIVDVTGMGQLVDGTILAWTAETHLYGPFKTLSDAQCVSAHHAGMVSFSGAGDGTFNSPEFAPAKPGVYTFVTTVTRNLDGEVATHDCGVASESFTVSAPSAVDTQAVNALVVLGGETQAVADNLTISGMYDGGWSATVSLYGPFAGIDDAVCSADHLVGSASFTGNGDGTFQSPTVNVTEGGVYTFIATVTRDIDGQTASHPCALEAESFSALGDVSVITNASAPEVALGVMTHDNVSISGMGQLIDGTVMAWTAKTHLYGPFASLAAAQCIEDHHVGTVSFAGDGDGNFSSPQIAASLPGMYTFITEVTRTHDGAVATHDCGLAVESFVATAPLSVTTQTVNAIVLVEGDVYPASDILTIDGAYGGSWTATADLYGPFESLDAAVCNADHLAGSVSFTGIGDGVFQSPTVNITEGGVYTFVASVVRDIDGETASHDCGLAAETLTVTVEVPELPKTGSVEPGRNVKLALILAVFGLVLAVPASRRWERES